MKFYWMRGLGCIPVFIVMTGLGGCGTSNSIKTTEHERSPRQSKMDLAFTLSRRTEYLNRRDIYSIADVEAVLGPPRRLSGTIAFTPAYSFLYVKHDYTDFPAQYSPNSNEFRRYSVDGMKDLVVRYRSMDGALKESYWLEENRYIPDLGKVNSSTAEGYQRYQNKWNEAQANEKIFRDKLNEVRSQCLAAGFDELAVYGRAKEIQLTHAERRTAWMEDGEGWLKEQNAAQAARCFEEAAKVEPVSEQALWKAAVAHTAAGAKERATSALARFRQAATPEQQSQAADAVAKLESQIEALREP